MYYTPSIGNFANFPYNTLMIVFDGYQFAQEREDTLKQRVQILSGSIAIAAILFEEDKGSQLYTRLKKEAAERVGIRYHCLGFSMSDDLGKVLAQLKTLNEDSTVTGIIIQKPARGRWMEVTGKRADEYVTWWHALVSQINQTKDVDGLHPETLAAIQHGTWKQEKKVMPATVKAVLEILNVAKEQVTLPADPIYIILGRSDILGQPLFYELRNQGQKVEIIGSKELTTRVQSGQSLHDADVVISATGHPHLIVGGMIKQGAVVVDVGEPQPDVEFATVAPKAAFITPVPGGVGPVTVVSLLENAKVLAEIH